MILNRVFFFVAFNLLIINYDKNNIGAAPFLFLMIINIFFKANAKEITNSFIFALVIRALK